MTDSRLYQGTLNTYCVGDIDLALEHEGFLSILFHPFLETSEEKLEVFEDVPKCIANNADIFRDPYRNIAAVG